jgi:hypothetical protein
MESQSKKILKSTREVTKVKTKLISLYPRTRRMQGSLEKDDLEMGFLIIFFINGEEQEPAFAC